MSWADLNINMLKELKFSHFSKMWKQFKEKKEEKATSCRGFQKIKKSLFLNGIYSNIKKFYISKFFFDLIKQGFIRQGKKGIIDKLMFKVIIHGLQKNKAPKVLWLSNTSIELNLLQLVKLKERKSRRFVRYKIDYMTNKYRLKRGILEVVKSLKQNSNSKLLLEKINGVTNDLKKGLHKANEVRNEYHKTALKWIPYKWKKINKKRDSELNKTQKLNQQKRGKKILKI